METLNTLFLMYVIFICSAKQEKACWPTLRSFYLWDETTRIVTRCACVTLKAWTSFSLWKVTVKHTRFYLQYNRGFESRQSPAVNRRAERLAYWPVTADIRWKWDLEETAGFWACCWSEDNTKSAEKHRVYTLCGFTTTEHNLHWQFYSLNTNRYHIEVKS